MLQETNQRVLEWVQKHAMLQNGERILDGWGHGLSSKQTIKSILKRWGKGTRETCTGRKGRGT